MPISKRPWGLPRSRQARRVCRQLKRGWSGDELLLPIGWFGGFLHVQNAEHEISCDCLGFSVWTPRATPPHRGASIWKGRQMTTARKPAKRPANTHFSSGPCAKRPGWSLKNLEHALLGRSHRAKEGKARLK